MPSAIKGWFAAASSSDFAEFCPVVSAVRAPVQPVAPILFGAASDLFESAMAASFSSVRGGEFVLLCANAKVAADAKINAAVNATPTGFFHHRPLFGT
jgi:hypothetical protein